MRTCAGGVSSLCVVAAGCAYARGLVVDPGPAVLVSAKNLTCRSWPPARAGSTSMVAMAVARADTIRSSRQGGITVMCGH
jgi:hypothetical protein